MGLFIMWLFDNVDYSRDKREVDRDKLWVDDSKNDWDELIEEASSKPVKSVEQTTPSLQQEKKVMGFVSAMENHPKAVARAKGGTVVPYSEVLKVNHPELDPVTGFGFTLDDLKNKRLEGVDLSLLSDEDLVAFYHGGIKDVSDEGLRIIVAAEDKAEVVGELATTEGELATTKRDMALLRNETKVQRRKVAAAREKVEREKNLTWRFWNTLGELISGAVSVGMTVIVAGIFGVALLVALVILGIIAMAVVLVWLHT